MFRKRYWIKLLNLVRSTWPERGERDAERYSVLLGNNAILGIFWVSSVLCF